MEIGELLGGVRDAFSGLGERARMTDPTYVAAKAAEQRYAAQDERQRKLDELAMNKERVAAMTQDFSQTLSLINSGRPDLALQLLDNRLPLIEKMGGDTYHTQTLRDKIAENSPDVVPELTAFLTAAGKMPAAGAQYSGIFTTQDGQRAGLNANTGQIEVIPSAGGITARVPLGESGIVQPSSDQKNLQQYQQMKAAGDPDAEAFGRATGLLSAEGTDLSVHLQRRLSLATDAAQEARTNASQFTVLANEFDKSKGGSGVLGSSWKERMKEFSGTQDADTLLRKRYLALRSSQVVKNLPPGAASDADIAMALEGFLPANADNKITAQFLRGMAKLEDYQDQFESFKAGYISDNGTERNMLESWRSQAASEKPGASTPNKPGGKLMVDAAGNRAIVYPDGTVEEQ